MPKTHSEAVLADGPLIFLAGQEPVAPDGGVAAGDAAEQTRQIFTNMEDALAPYGAGIQHLVKVTYYLRHLTDLEAVRRVLGEWLVHDPKPAGTLVEVGGFTDPRFVVQIDAVACLTGGRR